MIGYLDTFCKGCIYHAKSTRSCDYFIIENRLRGCPGGDGCRARRTKKDVRKAMQPKWDTALGKQMWEEGKTDRQIADHFGIAPNTVLYQRQKKWEKDTTSTPPEDESDDTVSSVDLVREETTLLPQAQSAGHVPDLYEVLEAATAQLQGIRAICTADAISQLWNWSSRDNLLRARSAIDHLIKRME